MKNKTRAFIDRTPLRFIGGAFILGVGILAKSLPLIILGIFDLGISFLFFLKPTIEYKKRYKLPIILLYGFILIWSAFWLTTLFSQ
jgi:hypothetical protein